MAKFYFPRPHKLFRRPVFAACRRGFRLKPCPDTKHDVPRLIRGAESQIIGVLVRTVLQLGFPVQSSGKKRCGRRVGELRKWVSACNEPTGSHACEPLSLWSLCVRVYLSEGGTFRGPLLSEAASIPAAWRLAVRSAEENVGTKRTKSRDAVEFLLCCSERFGKVAK